MYQTKIFAMNKPKAPRSLEERVAACPIHQWMPDLVVIAQSRFGMPDPIVPIFQEVVLKRGEYPVEMSAAERAEFASWATNFFRESGLQPQHGQFLFRILIDLFAQWVSYRRRLN